MELFEKINRAFGGWYEGLFGSSDDVRPKDILRKILVALEENRKEGFDNKVYVPNQYILEIAVDDPEEKEYLLSFLDREELETAIRRYCQQNHYAIRGALDFTISEVDLEVGGKRRDKVRVRCRYDSKLAAQKDAPAVEAAAPEAPMEAAAPARYEPQEDATIGEMDYDGEMGTVPAIASARLIVHPPGTPAFEYRIARSAVSIGRSPRAGNDIVLEGDGMISRKHARIELDADGLFTLYDLQTTNGTRVNGRRIDNQGLKDGDEIQVGSTRIVFQQEAFRGEEDRSASRTAPMPQGRSVQSVAVGTGPRLVLTDGTRDLDTYLLASDTVVGRGLTNDIVLSDRSIATRHIRITRGNPFTLEVLDSGNLTLLNGMPLAPAARTPLRGGDRIGIGTLTLRFEETSETGEAGR